MIKRLCSWLFIAGFSLSVNASDIESNQDALSQLPHELRLFIVFYLPFCVKDKLSLFRVNKSFSALLNDENFFTQLFAQEFGGQIKKHEQHKERYWFILKTLQKCEPYDRMKYFCQHGYINALSGLIAQGVQIESPNDSEKSLIYIASENGHEALVGYLIEQGIDINKDSFNHSFPLYIASQLGHLQTVKRLVENGANIEKTYRGFTPIYIAACKGHEPIVSYLINKKSDINKKGGDDSTPLYVASQNGHHSVVKVLLEHNALKTPFQNCSVIFIAAQNGHFECLRLLAESFKEEIDKVGFGGLRPVEIANKNLRKECLALLLELGVKPVRLNH